MALNLAPYINVPSGNFRSLSWQRSLTPRKKVNSSWLKMKKKKKEDNLGECETQDFSGEE